MKNLEKHTAQVQEFIKAHDREPTALDFDSSPLLPTARTIQRVYKGLPQFRALVGLKNLDFTKGQLRTVKAKTAIDLCIKMETEIFQKLLALLGSDKVSSPARIFLNSGKTVDFKIEINNKIYLIDVFYPSTNQSFKGCVNLKNKKYTTGEESFYVGPYEILLVCLNEKVMSPTNSKLRILNETEFNALVENKK